MTNNLGPEIKIDGKRPDWLADDEKISIVWWDGARWDNLNTRVDCVSGWEHSVTAIMLRADHPYYFATSKGFTYWPGGDSAPDADEVMFRSREVVSNTSHNSWFWRHNGHSRDIIGYRKRAEPVQNDDDYVRVKRIPAGDVDGIIRRADYDIESVLRELGIIRDETTIEQFERDHGGLDNNQRDIVNAFIEWQKGNS